MSNAKRKSVQVSQIAKLFLRISKPYTWSIIGSIIIIALTVIGGIIGPLLIARLLEIVQHGQLQNNTEIWQLIGMYAAVQVWSDVVGWRIAIYLAWRFETAMQRDIYQQAFNKLTQETLFFHASRMSGSLVSQTNKLSGAIERFWDTVLWSILPLLISIAASIAILFTLLWQYALLLTILSILFALVVFFGSRPMAILNKKEADASNAMNGHLTDTLGNILVVKSAGAEQSEQRAFSQSTTTWRTASLGVMGGFLRISTVYSSITTSIKIAAIILAIIAAQQHLISVAAIYLIATYTTTVARELLNMNSIMRSYNHIIGDAQAMTEILATPTHLVNTHTAHLRLASGSIAIDRITYTHDEGKGATLFKDFSLTIQPGEKVGLVGASGSGKTTLTKLLLRFADIEKGAITIDGQNIAEVTQASLRQSIAYVPQEPVLFHRSVRENIAYGKPEATEEAVRIAAKKAGALGFITDLTDGFDTIVGERGVKLSGGQRQRIAIARAILKDAPILILDEATSALDSESETLIQKSLTALMKDRTSIVVAHRLSTIAKLDRIIVMRQGKIIENGSHETLLAKQGTYAKLWQHQSGGFIDT